MSSRTLAGLDEGASAGFGERLREFIAVERRDRRAEVIGRRCCPGLTGGDAERPTTSETLPVGSMSGRCR